ncbi:MAG: OsmC family protein [Planctomycetota bacterium]|jgi:uncharacterized OsmC-like protein
MSVKEQVTINGVDVEQLKKIITAIRENPPLAEFLFRARNIWLGGSRNRSTIKDFYGCGEEDTTRTKPYILENDEPKVMLGEDEAPNPVEFVLHALAGCLTTTLVCHGASRGIEIESIESSLEGDIDIQGFLGLSDEVPRGYKAIQVKLRVKSDAPVEKLAELSKYSPVYHTISNPVPVEVTIEKV